MHFASKMDLAESDNSIIKYKKRYAIFSQESDGRIALDNLVELAVNAYEVGYVTYEKFEYLLGLCGLKPEDFDIMKVSGNTFPSDEELDSIMEG